MYAPLYLPVREQTISGMGYLPGSFLGADECDPYNPTDCADNDPFYGTQYGGTAILGDSDLPVDLPVDIPIDLPLPTSVPSDSTDLQPIYPDTPDSPSMLPPGAGLTPAQSDALSAVSQAKTPAAQSAAVGAATAAGISTAMISAAVAASSIAAATAPAAPAFSLASIGSWFSQSTLISGVPNYAIAGGGVLALAMLGGGGSGRKRR